MPLDNETKEQFNCWDVDSSAKVHLLKIDDDTLFYIYWNSGLFQRINSVCNCLIDDYEEECIQPDDINKLIRVLMDEFVEHPQQQVREFCKRLFDLCNIAIKNHMPVFFVL